MTPLEELARKIAEKYALEEEGEVWKVSKDVIDELTASFLKIRREALEEAAKIATEFNSKKPNIEELQFILNRSTIGAKAKIEPNGTMMMNDFAVGLLIAKAIRNLLKEK